MPGASMSSGSDAYHDLCCYTLAHGGAEFIHQHVVDAFGAQEASANDRPIRLVFSLIGLYLHVERGFTGREVQLAHMKLGQRKQVWPVLAIPEQPGAVTAVEVCAAPLSDRDSMIHKWCHSVWQAFAAHREVIEHLLAEHGITDSRSVRQHTRSGK